MNDFRFDYTCARPCSRTIVRTLRSPVFLNCRSNATTHAPRPKHNQAQTKVRPTISPGKFRYRTQTGMHKLHSIAECWDKHNKHKPKQPSVSPSAAKRRPKRQTRRRHRQAQAQAQLRTSPSATKHKPKEARLTPKRSQATRPWKLDYGSV